MGNAARRTMLNSRERRTTDRFTDGLHISSTATAPAATEQASQVTCSAPLRRKKMGANHRNQQIARNGKDKS